MKKKEAKIRIENSAEVGRSIRRKKGVYPLFIKNTNMPFFSGGGGDRK